MKKCLLCLVAFSMLAAVDVYGQRRPQRQSPPERRAHQSPVAGFDVIILKNGDLIYGLVKEVGWDVIRYQRTDIPNGPIYLVPRNRVYAISYRNQIKEVLGPPGSFRYDDRKRDYQGRSYTLLNQSANAWGGIGLLHGSTKIDDADTYDISATFPMVVAGYEISKNRSLKLGITATGGSRKFTRQQFSAYDSAITNVELRERILALYAYGKYELAPSIARLQPYLLGGLGILSSSIKSEYSIDFINRSNQTVLVRSGTRSTSPGVLLRLGTAYNINNQISAFADAGVGPSIIHVGFITHFVGTKQKL